ncbi:LPS assembly lipoprotein LptE [Mesorhizobium sp. CO1-1-7]|uniref:Putative secreted (Periplasmic) protein n=1 Tax=Mesorhizobium australicum (strain HAMBI 3006 / LMG 24608 / WSM2073) TaxID=754035 RepID=L0KFA9_MESAW|nr:MULTISPECIES: LPS assembly lipoprotein LptE [Mesorhizobium]MBZ9932252.1 LPS assembly lipoprotein LptE [Mesorhizobium sp. BR1-1-5]AGB43691.1 putative secreted (periplasmic) protein [Mesorhizobium australicum WSM2073]MBZ9679331.1 LPS assembly lipoprotein LptE [Mesorhizobium sp. CO1-1-2]MBZ9726130.1 LPS assembly lipoprotein LptE [Mesorhizobium sp. CO1-1-11]MBZ9745536.1 LPS assembly lipoprotein LptE [Mesorhizobium sp. CO1-1-7]
MSLPDREKTELGRLLRRIALAGLVGSLALISACQVRPLYSSAPLSTGSTANAEMASIAVKPVRTRYAQQVRNNLIFGFGRGAGEPASPLYSLDLGVSEGVESSALVQNGTDQDEPTAGSVTLTAGYTLTDVKTGAVIAVGKRAITSSFDRPRQEFASYRAQIDAENRAARELAEALQLSIAQDLARHGKAAS